MEVLLEVCAAVALVCITVVIVVGAVTIVIDLLNS